jgi:uncharacterized protein (TIGR03437 family)
MRRGCHSIVALAVFLFVASCAPGAETAEPAANTVVNTNAPFFTAASIVQAASQTVETLAPNTLATIYGTNLSWTTHAVTSQDLEQGTLPTSLDHVTVYVQGITCKLLYISPGQINFLIPYELTGSTAWVLVARQGVAGPIGADQLPSVTIKLAAASPGFFEWSGNFIVAEHADGSLITADSPAKASETVVLFAAGLGRTVPDTASGVPPPAAATLLYASQLQIVLNGAVLPQASIYYAGVTPGYPGLYQINVTLPDVLPPEPEIQVVMGTQSSPTGVLLFTQ